MNELIDKFLFELFDGLRDKTTVLFGEFIADAQALAAIFMLLYFVPETGVGCLSGHYENRLPTACQERLHRLRQGGQGCSESRRYHQQILSRRQKT